MNTPLGKYFHVDHSDEAKIQAVFYCISVSASVMLASVFLKATDPGLLLRFLFAV